MSAIKQGYKQTKVGVIPEDWEIKYIEDIAEVKGGKRLPLGHELTEAITPYPYIRVTNMTMGGLNDKQILYVPIEVQPKIKNYTISKNDLYIAVAGNTLGMAGTIPAKFDGANLTENADKICNIKMNKEFLLFVLMSDLIQNVIQNEITTNAQPKLALTRIKKFHIPFPPLKEQEKIAEILTTWDEAITKQEELIKAKELQKKALMQKLLSGEVRFKEFGGETLVSLDGTKVPFPNEWEEVRLGEILLEPKKKKVSMPQNFELLTVKLHCNGIVKSGKKPNVTENGRPYYFVEPGELLIGRQNFHNGGFGIAPDNTENCLTSNAISHLKVKQNKCDIKFILFYMSRIDFYKRIDYLIGGTGQKEMSKGEFDNIKIKLPYLPEQQKIAEVLTLADDEINLLKNELKELKLQKKGLMQKLLTGEVRVRV